jgi:hypothetical protein
MALRIGELFGFDPADQSTKAVQARKSAMCPFVNGPCTKTFHGGTPSGVCSLRSESEGLVICCPKRLYADSYKVLLDVAEVAFGNGKRLINGTEVAGRPHDGHNVAVFGQQWGKELRLPKQKGRGAFFVDWVLAHIGTNGRLAAFVAVEVQTIDTTGNYRMEWDAIRRGETFAGTNKAGFNWENVSKRILPQLIYKGHVLRLEEKCTKGLFFICPEPVYKRIQNRLANSLRSYPIGAGTLTFRRYDPGGSVPAGRIRPLDFVGQSTTTVDQVAIAFTAPRDLPPSGSYERAIQAELDGNP